ncbi:MAG: 50S ribosomal protein L6 [Wenzhouxiangellaceae bacterium]
MSRVAKLPIALPKGVEYKQAGSEITVKGPKGSLSMELHPAVVIDNDDGTLQVRIADESNKPMAGTTRAMLNNMVVGVTDGFERKLQLVGVGYRAQAQGAKLNLSLGFSHPVEFNAPEGITLETPSQTEVIVRGINKQQVGQVAAKIRAYRPPEPYKGKGVRYADEHVVMKEAKKA